MRVTGTLYHEGQTWSCGINFMTPIEGSIPTDPIASETGLNSWSAAIKALHGGKIVPNEMLLGLSSSGAITGIRCSDVDADGREDAVSIIDLGAPVVGIGDPLHPGQVALAVTTRTSRPGASYRGRFYWPGVGYAINGEGRVPLVNIQGYATVFAKWIADLQAAGGAVTPVGIGAFVVSNARGVATRIESVSVGDRLDIQRRRGDKEKEVNGIAPVPD